MMKRRKEEKLKDIFFKRNGGILLQQQMSSEVPLLVYEFIPNGNLNEYIHDQNEYFPLTWEIRLRIATEISGALSYLHSSAGMPVYHRDIKSTNILLDQNYRAKVADFGTSRTFAMDQTHLPTKVQGTFGYLDPEYFQSSQFTEKIDVYSFGVVLVELLTGQKPIVSFKVGETRSLAMCFLSAMEENRLMEIIDPRVKMEGGEDQIKRFGELANRCLNLDGRKRPRMKQVAIELELIRTSNEAPKTEVEDDSIKQAEIWNTMSIGIESGPIITSSSSDTHPLLL
ncbi:hypothetical protein R6Q59_023960 [Mikania micrantha]